MDDHCLLQPEILDDDQLLQLLRDRGIKLEYGISKPKLLDVFHRLCVPLPQRQYKLSRRGKELEKMRLKQEQEMSKQRLSTVEGTLLLPSSSQKRHLDLQKYNPDSFRKERIKPSPDVVQIKKIRLNTSSTLPGTSKISNGGENYLDKIIIKDRSAEKKTDLELEKNEKMEQMLNRDSPEPTGSAVRKIKLKRPVIEKEGEQITELDLEESKPKKVRQKISWP